MGVEHAALGQSDAGVGKFAPTSRRSFVAVWCWRARSISTSTKVWNSPLNSDTSSKASRDPPTFSLSPRNVSCYCVRSVNCRRFYLTFIARSATWFTRFLTCQTTKIHVVLNVARLSLKFRDFFQEFIGFSLSEKRLPFKVSKIKLFKLFAVTRKSLNPIFMFRIITVNAMLFQVSCNLLKNPKILKNLSASVCRIPLKLSQSKFCCIIYYYKKTSWPDFCLSYHYRKLTILNTTTSRQEQR